MKHPNSLKALKNETPPANAGGVSFVCIILILQTLNSSFEKALFPPDYLCAEQDISAGCVPHRHR